MKKINLPMVVSVPLGDVTQLLAISEVTLGAADCVLLVKIKSIEERAQLLSRIQELRAQAKAILAQPDNDV